MVAQSGKGLCWLPRASGWLPSTCVWMCIGAACCNPKAGCAAHSWIVCGCLCWCVLSGPYRPSLHVCVACCKGRSIHAAILDFYMPAACAVARCRLGKAVTVPTLASCNCRSRSVRLQMGWLSQCHAAVMPLTTGALVQVGDEPSPAATMTLSS